MAQDQAPAKRARVQTVLEADKYGTYQPKSRETREAYAQLLQMVQTRLGDHPPEVLYGAAEEVLAVLKDADKRVRLRAFQMACCSITYVPVSGCMLLVTVGAFHTHNRDVDCFSQKPRNRSSMYE